MKKKQLLLLIILVGLFSTHSYSQTANNFPSNADVGIGDYRLTFASPGISYSGSGQGQIWRDPTWGFVFRSSSGSSYDFAIFDPAGNGIMLVPHGLQAALFSGDIGVGATKKIYLDGISNTYISEISADVINFATAGSEKMRIDASGNISIGTTDPKGYKLAVAGNIISEKVRVKLQANWPDYVFNQDYKLPSLKEVENFIIKNKHLPGVVSASEVEKEGLDLGDNQSTLLKKIEELTLYIIDQQKEIEKLKEKVGELSRKSN
ncbi:MAG: hypothetical protein V9F01_09275 [Chitinophagaceae bacterium]